MLTINLCQTLEVEQVPTVMNLITVGLLTQTQGFQITNTEGHVVASVETINPLHC